MIINYYHYSCCKTHSSLPYVGKDPGCGAVFIYQL